MDVWCGALLFTGYQGWGSVGSFRLLAGDSGGNCYTGHVLQDDSDVLGVHRQVRRLPNISLIYPSPVLLVFFLFFCFLEVHHAIHVGLAAGSLGYNSANSPSPDSLCCFKLGLFIKSSHSDVPSITGALLET